jgi:hypothetical protein
VTLGGTFGCENAWTEIKELGLGDTFNHYTAMTSFTTLKALYRWVGATCGVRAGAGLSGAGHSPLNVLWLPMFAWQGRLPDLPR